MFEQYFDLIFCLSAFFQFFDFVVDFFFGFWGLGGERIEIFPFFFILFFFFKKKMFWVKGEGFFLFF